MHDTLLKLGASSLQPVQCADEMKSQDSTFRTWLNETTSLLCAKLLKSDNSPLPLENRDTASTRFPIGRFVECKSYTHGTDGT